MNRHWDILFTISLKLMMSSNDGQTLSAHGGDLGEVQSETEQDDGVLQHLLRGEGDAVLHNTAGRLLPPKGDDHADEDGEHRTAHHGQRLAEKPAGDGDGGAQADLVVSAI